MTSEHRIEYPVSAGGVVYRIDEGEMHVVICGQHSPNGWLWGLPKGTPEPGETLEETALREVTEETGLKVTLEEPIASIQYWFASADEVVKYHKTVHFYLMSVVGGSFIDHDHEFDEVCWSHSQESLRTLTHRNEIDILDKAIEIVSQRARKEGDLD
jgi:8-oxo-dGTP pyrophosphatase MutT (NUDIX family)